MRFISCRLLCRARRFLHKVLCGFRSNGTAPRFHLIGNALLKAPRYRAYSVRLRPAGRNMLKMTSPRVAAITTFAMLAFAGNSLLCRVALRDTAIDAASFTSIRLASGALILGVIVRAQGGTLTGGGSWIAAAFLFAYAAAFSFAYRQLSAATGALLLFGAVQIAMLSWSLAMGERLRPLQLAGLLVALGGLVYMLLPGLAA